jgi:hypothetical protein
LRSSITAGSSVNWRGGVPLNGAGGCVLASSLACNCARFTPH